ncbi:MAG TPA: UMP kinase [Syntrophales bacterium]|nr:UMP kinase [Syntrophales bacterium]
MEKPVYRRILLKLSGEALLGKASSGIDVDMARSIGREIGEIEGLGVQVALVVGGGNFLRGEALSRRGIGRVTGDVMGMLATVMNGLALRDLFRGEGLSARVQSAVAMPQVAEAFDGEAARKYLEDGEIVIFAGGTGNPFFSTDTAAALRALETGADVLLKATKVDGVFDKDPVTYPDARRFERISYDAVLEKNLRVMDQTAVALCRDNALPVVVFNMEKAGNIRRVVCGEPTGTLIGGKS